MFYRDTWIDINLDAFEDNLSAYQKLTDKKIILVLKANAYGHGDTEMGNFAYSKGINFFAVSSLDEAIHLRKTGLKGDILVLGYTNPDFALAALEYSITLCIPSKEFADSLSPNLSGLKVQLKIDTGMNRIGLRTSEEVSQVISTLTDKGINITGIFSHYAASDNSDEQMSKKQFNRFQEIVTASHYSFEYIHIANTDGIIAMPENFTNAVRLGIGAYGFSTFKQLAPCLSLYTRLAMIKQIAKGDTVSYGAHYVAKKDELLGTIPIGYADGLIRKNEGRNVYIKNDIATIVGRICMDQSMILLSKNYPIGTKVELIGPHISLLDIAKQLDTIPYEVLTLLSDRIPRLYRYHQEIITTDLARFAKE